MTATGERIPLSLQQQFLTLVDHGDGNGPFGPMYTIVGGWRISGPLDVGLLRRVLDELVVRHEQLRTAVVLGDEPYQVVLPPAPVELTVRELLGGDEPDREVVAERLVNEIEALPYDRDRNPLLRVVLGRFGPKDAVLVLAAHHTAMDGWSAQIVLRDIGGLYAAAREGREPDLPPVRQYGEYVAWQQANPPSERTRAYWRGTLDGARIVALPTDRPRPEHGDFTTLWHRFLLDGEIRAGALEFATRTRTSPFIVMLAAYLVLLREQTGETDLTVPTFTPGRKPGWVLDTVGSFYNMLPLRTDIAGAASFLDVVGRVRRTCLGAYTHEVPFLVAAEDAPDLMAPVMEPDRACCVFQVVQSPLMMGGERVSDLRFTAIRRRVISQASGSQLPDGALLALELHPAGDIVGKLGLTGNLFDEDTAPRMVAELREVFRSLLVSPAAGRLSA